MLLISDLAFGQSGFYGSKNVLELEGSLGPSFKRESSIQAEGSSRKLRLIFPNYKITYGRVLSNKIQLSIGYSYSKYRTASRDFFVESKFDVTDPNTGDIETNFLTSNILRELKMTFQTIRVEMRIFSKGTIAPVGTYTGYSLMVGFGSMNSPQELIIGKRGAIKNESFFDRIHTVGQSDTLQTTEDYSFKSLHLHYTMGRIYPLTKRIGLDFGLSIPLISLYTSSNVKQVGYFMNKGVSMTLSDRASWTKLLMYTARKYNQFSIKAGVLLFF